jgi:hypothetical protein
VAGKAAPLRVPTPGTYLGNFRIKKFDIGDNADLAEYEALRTKANKRSSGVVIENIRDLNEVTEITDAERNRIRNERWYIVVSWWEKEDQEPPTKNPPDPEQGFYVERPARAEGEN